MFAEERQRLILSLLQREGRVRARELAKSIGVSIDSIRRDLAVLEEAGRLRRTHGGAVPLALPQPLLDGLDRHEPVRERAPAAPFAYAATAREGTAGLAKTNPFALAADGDFKELAAAASACIERGDRLFIGGHPVHLTLAGLLVERAAQATDGDRMFEVVTHAPAAALMLASSPAIRVWLCGGCLSAGGVVLDASATDFVRARRVDLCLWAGDGFSSTYGASMERPEEADLWRVALQSARTRIALCDRRIVGHEAFAKVADASEFDAVLLDPAVPPDQRRQLESAGLPLVAPDGFGPPL
ncbi:DeoR/GlpR family DNA-binding transcription regulator [Paenibacillus thermoaerophilus]|uniref:Lactose phosphotransferase system repressor n=1 Tax=Paenibacillus thermoaerophilus TaxID=1215385 RepID=A0ABW2V7N3_9BACL|nr:DeoR/GlpR family DNA-binding transcription regulator [Paenibacillus thermoaerophilus]